ncbi:hypothetical protein DITRI_Ditri12bG0006600 [Diplodiscus trichospermus]
MSHFITAALNSRSSPSGHQKRRKLKKYNSRMKGLTGEVEDVRLEQKEIKEGQRQVRHKLKAIEAECEGTPKRDSPNHTAKCRHPTPPRFDVSNLTSKTQ